jgi:hypothetical protein
MSSQLTKTNNDAAMLESKIQLRINSLPADKLEIKVLEAFGGEGILWDAVKRRCPEKLIKVLAIDKNDYQRVQLQGDNVKWLYSLNLNEFDIIDLDAWGSPVKQLEILFSKKYKGIVHCTFISTKNFNPDKILSNSFGFNRKMVQKSPSLFCKHPYTAFINYLAINGVKKIQVCESTKKNYLWFMLDK